MNVHTQTRKYILKAELLLLFIIENTQFFYVIDNNLISTYILKTMLKFFSSYFKLIRIITRSIMSKISAYKNLSSFNSHLKLAKS